MVGGGGRAPGAAVHLPENAIHQSGSSWYCADGVWTTRAVTRMKGGIFWGEGCRHPTPSPQ